MLLPSTSDDKQAKDLFKAAGGGDPMSTARLWALFADEIKASHLFQKETGAGTDFICSYHEIKIIDIPKFNFTS